jgi:hypothetical protein
MSPPPQGIDSLEFRLGEVQTRLLGAGGVAEVAVAAEAETAEEEAINSASAAVRSGRRRDCIVDEKSENGKTMGRGKGSKQKKTGKNENVGETEAVNGHGLHG